MRKRIGKTTTSTLRAMEQWLDQLPLFVMRELRAAIKEELLARELPNIADDSGGFTVAQVGGVH